MDAIKYNRTRNPLFLQLYLTIPFVLLLAFIQPTTVKGSVEDKVSFTWQANPPDEYVIGYRLYYGQTSRFDANGVLKNNFTYDYYIDLADYERCVPGDDPNACETLSTDEITCENLSGTFPVCNIYNLQGHLYFALTAFNFQAESDFTPELDMNIVTANSINAIQLAVNMLLLKEDE